MSENEEIMNETENETVAAEDADKAIEILKANGEDAYRRGENGVGRWVQLL